MSSAGFWGSFWGSSATIPIVAGRATGIVSVLGTDGEVEDGVTISIQLVKPAPGAGTSGDMQIVQKVSANGGVSFPGLIANAEYLIWRGKKKVNYYSFVVPQDAIGTTFQIRNHIGLDI